MINEWFKGDNLVMKSSKSSKMTNEQLIIMKWYLNPNLRGMIEEVKE